MQGRLPARLLQLPPGWAIIYYKSSSNYLRPYPLGTYGPRASANIMTNHTRQPLESTQPAQQSADLDQPGDQPELQAGPMALVERQQVTLFEPDKPLSLACGQSLGPITVAYETHGHLNHRRDNAILILHALSGDAHVAGRHTPNDPKPGWWDIMVGPGKPFDTDRYFVICSNCLGGCMGTTGPSSTNPRTGEPYGLTFPAVSISDMVELQRALVDHLGIDQLLAVVGGSMGGMQVLDWAIRYPDRLAAALPIATTARLSAQGIAFDAVGRNAILRDENFQAGQYYHLEKFPAAGLAVARMVGHITYLSEEAMHAKFGRRLQSGHRYRYDFASEFSVETYLDHQGSVFVDRFDANTYLYFSKAMDYFDLPLQYGSLTEAMRRTSCRFLVVSFASDWLFPPRQSREIVDALLAADKDVTYCNINCPYGHDSFLLETQLQGPLIQSFLAQTHARLGHHGDPAHADPVGTAPAGIAPRPISSHATQCNTQPSRHRRSIFSGQRVDHRQIAALIAPNSTVLDLGCGDGQLLALLQTEKATHSRGVTLAEHDVLTCVQHGIGVLQYDLEKDLAVFADKSFDYVVLSQTFQVIKQPAAVLPQMLRIGRQVIISLPNVAQWRSRLHMMFRGRSPAFGCSPYCCFDEQADGSFNCVSIADFEHFVRHELGARQIQCTPLSSRTGRRVRFLPNLLADEAIFVIA